MGLSKRIEAIELALAKQHGETGYRLVIRCEDESDDDARARVDLGDWSGPIIFLSFADANL